MRNFNFSLGMALVVLGAFDLYAGLSQTGLGESAFVCIAQSFMLLFPGSVFLAYSLQARPRLTSLSDSAGEDGSTGEIAANAAAPTGENVVVFPGASRRKPKAGHKPRAYSQ